ncbi:4Fe-4S cluster-binding domain-containing protein, partial [Thioclava sp. BHET1]
MPRALTSVADLTEAGLAAPQAAERLEMVANLFRIRISPEMQAAIGPGAADPVARQFVPEAAELMVRPEERLDPIGDHAHEPVAGLTHRYPDRVILALTQTCEVYCRFCFRRETVGDAGALTAAELEAVYGYLAAHPEIREVILTGGDPLVLSPRRLRGVMERLAAIGSVDLVRFHSRIPVVSPQKMSA